MALAGTAQREIAQARERTEAAYKTLTDERAQWQVQQQRMRQIENQMRQIESRDLALQHYEIGRASCRERV